MDFAQQVKAATDIVAVVEGHVRLKRQGASRHIGLCPFHSEKTPSFSVHAGLQIYKCFGCGKSGDVFNFLMELQGLSFFEALQHLAEQAGIEMPRTAKWPGADADARRREALLYIHEIAQKFFLQQLRAASGAAALRYLQGRGLSGDDLAEFGIGYAPPGNALVRHLKSCNLKRGEVRDSGLIGEAQDKPDPYDRFRDRITIPIHADSGKLIAFGGRGRHADQQPKYLNSPETPLYSKNSVLYNLHRARRAMRQQNLVVLVEGYMDVMGVWRAGIRNAVATCGTALTPQQVRLIRRHCDTVVVNFDSDPAGQAAAERSVDLLLREGLNVRVLELPGGMDPDEYCRAEGGEAYVAQLKSAPRFFLWLLDRSRRSYDLGTAEGRTAAFESLLKFAVLLPDQIQRATTVTELADHIGLQQSVALDRLRLATNQPSRSAGPSVRPPDALSPGERLLLLLLVSSEEARTQLLDEACRVAEQGLPSRAILHALRAAADSGGPFQYTALEGRLEAADRERLARLVHDRDRPVPQICEGEAALRALRRKLLQESYRNVRRRIAAGSRAGKGLAELKGLLDRKMELERELGLVDRLPT